ncbi:MAG TPA: ACP S-malonyltransferase [Acholeplasma sp.]|jgi:[acyl-carrier-protein] S-malonyltransferase|nr:ACP S-malonyltransferase [Acholeplasma sp.]
MKTVLLFPGQGAQFINMGLDFLEQDPSLNIYFDKVERALKENVKDILGSEKIHETKYSQPLIFLTSVLAFESFKKRKITYDAVLGFSLGEYTALYASGILSFDDTLNLIKLRGEWMQEVADTMQGGMRAVLGLKANDIEEVIKGIPNVFVANYNEPNQTVITGDIHALDNASKRLSEKGARRVLPLKVSGAFHSPFMAPVGKKLSDYIQTLKMNQQNVDLYLNTTGDKRDNEPLYKICEQQVQSPVRFMQAINQLKKDGYTKFIELGPGQVLTGLVKKIDNNLEVANIQRQDDNINLGGNV